MSIEAPAALVGEADTAVEARPAASTMRIESAIALLFAIATVLGVSFLAVIIGLG